MLSHTNSRFALLPLFLAGFVEAGQSPNVLHAEQFYQVCRVWGSVRYLHPFLAHKRVDWERAWVQAMPRLEHVLSDDEFESTLKSMLGHLGDSSTFLRRIADSATMSNSVADRPRESWLWYRSGVLLIRPTIRLSRGSELASAVVQLRKEVSKARALVVDLRVRTRAEGEALAQTVDSLQELLIHRGVVARQRHYLLHSGFKPPEGGSSGRYFTALVTELAEGFRIGKGRSIPVAFTVNENSHLPMAALALQKSGNAVIVSEGNVTEENVGNARRIKVRDNLEVVVRTHEFVDGFGFRVDLAVAPEPVIHGSDFVIGSALKLLRQPRFRAGAGKKQNADVSDGMLKKETENVGAFPQRAHRLLGLCHLWNAIEYFYPYKELLDEDWGAVLRNFLPRFEEASNSQEYALAIAELSTHIPDGHVTVVSEALKEFFGVAAPPVAARVIEEQLAVVGYLDETSAREVGIEVGDVILEVDGEPATDRLRRYEKYLAASTASARRARAARFVLHGPESDLTLRIVDKTKRIRDVLLKRKREFYGRQLKRSGDVVALLRDDIGYVDLERLTADHASEVFEKLGGTKAIIFDLRGYPQGTMPLIAPWLVGGRRGNAALFRRPLVSPDPREEKSFEFVQRVGETEKSKYHGQVFALIDDRTISQGEHSALYLESAARTTSVGTPSAGTNGDVTYVYLPGGVTFYFTGQAVMHGDGRALQRIGIVPDVHIAPTLTGIRTGKDEVLAKAFELAAQKQSRTSSD